LIGFAGDWGYGCFQVLLDTRPAEVPERSQLLTDRFPNNLWEESIGAQFCENIFKKENRFQRGHFFLRGSGQQCRKELFEVFSFLEQMVFIGGCPETQLVRLVIAQDKLDRDIAEALPQFSSFVHLRAGFEVVSLNRFNPIRAFVGAHIGNLDPVFLLEDPFLEKIEEVGNFPAGIAGFIEKNGKSLTGGGLEEFHCFRELVWLMEE
jgi:hypothetical protein